MNIFVTSDTHGHLEKTYEMFEKLSGLTADGERIDKIIHCGDYQRDAGSIEGYLATPVISAAGNCDGQRGRDFKICKTPYGSILVTHGHTEGVDSDYSRLVYLAQENDCFAACFGHTHIPVYDEYAGITLINPGSLTFPRDGTAGSCALINATEDDFSVAIYYYANFFDNKDKKKSRGGFLRGMINYSDRF
jgi:putative phosphoesterase